jgi:hypothetical protein
VTPQPLHDALSGKLIDETDVAEKAPLPITTEDSQEKTAAFKLVQLAKAPCAILVTEAGIVRVPLRPNNS